MDTSTAAKRRPIPRVSGGGAVLGNLQELRHDPVGLLSRVRAECGEVGEFRMLDRRVVLLSGETAQELFFRAHDEQIDPQPTAVRMTKPIFGDGVVYDLPPERRRETLRTPALRDENLRKSAGRIGTETERMLDGLGTEGEVDLLALRTIPLLENAIEETLRLHPRLGANFAVMQLKAIFSILLRRYTFELVGAPGTYTDDDSRMIVLPRQPCRVRYRAR